MRWYVGVDGGGTKTAFAVSAADGVPVATIRRTGCSYQAIGIEAAVSLVSGGVREILTAVGAGLEDCAGCCVGIPCYGEHAGQDRIIDESLRTALAPAPVHLVNDVEVGWAGALECQEGMGMAFAGIVALPGYGFIYDITGSYVPVLWGICALHAACMVCLFLAFAGKKKLERYSTVL